MTGAYEAPGVAAEASDAVRSADAAPGGRTRTVLTAITRRQHEHRQRTVDRLTTVLDSGLLSAELTEISLYYWAKAHKDLSQDDAARAGMQQVAEPRRPPCPCGAAP
ncbi:hypothetical protein AB0L74_29265 [Streptomyces sp. NPDC052020]|uniref:hypothetical protein n=1 Tax=Streptomyces sp. NPDC052020 TaxID=3155677 RepID=UPI00342848B0